MSWSLRIKWFNQGTELVFSQVDFVRSQKLMKFYSRDKSAAGWVKTAKSISHFLEIVEKTEMYSLFGINCQRWWSTHPSPCSAIRHLWSLWCQWFFHRIGFDLKTLHCIVKPFIIKHVLKPAGKLMQFIIKELNSTVAVDIIHFSYVTSIIVQANQTDRQAQSTSRRMDGRQIHSFSTFSGSPSQLLLSRFVWTGLM